MKITTKINLITTTWIICVLIAVNAVVFFSFMKITVNMEDDELLQKASVLIKELGKETSAADKKEKLTPYLANHSYIRVINPDSKIVNQVTNDQPMAAKIKAEFAAKKGTDRLTIKLKNKEEQIAIVRVPIEKNGQVVGTLEFGKKLAGLELGKDLLLSILAFCTILGAVLSLLGGRWLSNLIMRPISNMINTMEDIEQSGIPKKIDIQLETKDELQKLAVTFNRMIGRLETNLEKQRQFISDASHELKTPLTVIKSYADLLLRRGIQNEAVARDAIESIHSEATRIQKMTERFLDLADTESGNLLESKEINLVSLCENIGKQLQAAYKRMIDLHVNEASITVVADEVKLKQAIIILIDNAIKYSMDKIDVYLEDTEKGTSITVKDYGIGVPEGELENIFERFYRVDKARSRETGGTGLGLAIAKNIIKQHHGEIKIKSTEGVGTEAKLFLPKRK
ncbi:sensor histidine kinase [Neobacillus vireti]|uniref:Signal transduction histidine-protein kinase ArlS n=1 Tax=Neobacillus vireti LMG 21834 TaxID=1131730 RepID=A0AB94IFP4_9BACI|nr:ATP-binding protein [Neobacillus vireti]ETI65932.1 integral membrane sensor signal transduction histidine kinase [Neobacillus vireti LMG 21834]KLT18300.1 histidine kinase [Neobacillus vireti]